MQEPVITRDSRGENGYFTVRWSEFRKADKYAINASVPAMGGIAEIYYMDEYRKLNIFCVTRSWYGGLRSNLRELTDPELEKDPVRRSILVEYKDKIYYRYSLTDSLDDMNDVLFYLTGIFSPVNSQVKASGRYKKIFVNEVDPQKLTTI